MSSPAVCPTITQRVRSFLQQQGVHLRPWSSLDATYAELYELLRRRRGDRAFWPPLTRLLDEIVEQVRSPAAQRRLAAPEAEVLASWDIAALVSQLRAALPAESETSPETVRRFGSALSAPVLSAFVLLGLAMAGCSGNTTGTPDVPTPAQDTGPSAITTAVSATAAVPEVPPAEPGCGLDATGDLRRTIESAALGETDKKLLCHCIAALDQSWNDGLTKLFETAEPEAIARVLEQMVDCVCGPTDAPGEFRADFLSALCGVAGPNPNAANPAPPPEQTKSRNPVITAVPLYKGVSFPDP